MRGAWLLALACAACGSSDPSAPEAARWLYTQSAASGTAQPAAGGGAEGELLLLTLDGASSTTLGFSDRPERDTRLIPTAAFSASWDTLFALDAPNGAVSYDGAEEAVPIELTHPVYDPAAERLTYLAKPLSAARLPDAFSNPTLFIDDADAVGASFGPVTTTSALTGHFSGESLALSYSALPGARPAALGYGVDVYTGAVSGA